MGRDFHPAGRDFHPAGRDSRPAGRDTGLLTFPRSVLYNTKLMRIFDDIIFICASYVRSTKALEKIKSSK